MSQRDIEFRPYTEEDGGGRPTCAVAAITPPDEAHMHTYYDVCPFSPSGRLLACLRLPFEDRQPAADDPAELCVLDLPGRTLRTLCPTTAWGFQTGAHQQWGRSDRYLYFNDKRDGRPVGVRLDLESGERRFLEGPIWQIDAAERFAISPCLIRANLTQPGYGVSVEPDRQLANRVRAAEDDGLFRVDLRTGRQTLLISLAAVWEALADRQDLQEAVLYAFHCKFNPQGTRILLVVRARFDDGRFVASLLTARPDGSELRTIVPHRLWRRGGHHPIWHPNGRQVLMNLTPDERGMRFCLIDAQTSQLQVLMDDPPGSGHPSISADGALLLTDATRESASVRFAPIRLVDLPRPGQREGRWRDLCTLRSPAVAGSPLRRDAHPVWDRDCRRICFLAAPGGKRQLFLADPQLPPGELPQF